MPLPSNSTLAFSNSHTPTLEIHGRQCLLWPTCLNLVGFEKLLIISCDSSNLRYGGSPASERQCWSSGCGCTVIHMAELHRHCLISFPKSELIQSQMAASPSLLLLKTSPRYQFFLLSAHTNKQDQVAMTLKCCQIMLNYINYYEVKRSIAAFNLQTT